MSAQVQAQENLTIFWDLETTRSSATTTVSTYDVVKNIRAAVAPFGAIKGFRAYSDFSAPALPRPSELSSSGVTLVDCPGDGRRELPAKIMIVDVLLHAWDHPHHTFVIITGDRDMAYSISSLRMRNYSVVVISPATTHRDLTAQATAHLDWSRVVLGMPGGVLDDEDFPDHPHPPKEPPFNGTHFASSSQSMGLNHNNDDRKQGPPVELHDLRSRGRKNSVFSTNYDPRKFNVFGDYSHEFTTPKTRSGSFGLGDGPLFPRPSRQSRSDSAPPKLPMPGLAAYASPGEKFMSPGIGYASSKGKQREQEKFDDFEPEGLTPEMLPEPLTYSGSIFEPFGDSQRPFQAMSTSPDFAKKGPTQTSTVSSSSSDSSKSSLVNHDQLSTGPTSAEPPSIADKSDITVKPRTVLEGATETEYKQVHAVTVPTSSRRHSVTSIAAPSAKPNATEPVADLLAKEPMKTEPGIVHSTTVQPSVVPTSKSTIPNLSEPPTIVSQPPAPVPPPATFVTPQNPIKPIPPIPSTSTSTTTRAAPPVPQRFAVLVKVLSRDQQGKFSAGVPKSMLGTALIKEKDQAYRPGKGRLGSYIAEAVQAGIVRYSSGGQCVCLQPQYS